MTQGWLCAKVRPYLAHVYHPDRLMYPLRRVGPKGSAQWERISWNAAIAEITDRWKKIIADDGAAAILPYSYSGTLGLVQNLVCEQRLWNRMGASGLQRSICGAAAERAVNATLGSRLAPNPDDVLDSRLVILWGHNPASTSPHFMPLLRQAQRAGCYVVVIDPRRTKTARSADEHIQPRPATDGALALGLMHVLAGAGLHNEEWLQRHALGWPELQARLAEYPPERVAAITGVPVPTIVALARRYAGTHPALIKIADGLQRHGNGGQTVRAITCLPALVGQYGVRGGGLFYSTSGYLLWNGNTVAHLRECPPTPRMINMNRLGAALTGEVQEPPIQALYVFNANPVASTPNAGLIVRGLQREDLFTVVHELFMTDTARYADIVLPATSQLEHVDLHKAYGQLTLQYNAPAIAPPGACQSNWDVMRRLAAGMGYHDAWLQQDADEMIAEVLATTHQQGVPRWNTYRQSTSILEGITLERLKDEGALPLNIPSDFVPFATGDADNPVVFPTASGKVLLRCDLLAQEGLDPLPMYVPPAEFAAIQPAGDVSEHANLYLISGASHHFVSSSLASQSGLRAKEGPPFVEINPQDAAARDITHGDQVIVQNGRGTCQLRAIVTADVPPGVAVAPKGQWAQLSPDGHNINWTTSDALGDLAGQSTFHSNLVKIWRKDEANS
jgi:anaerobic selenocysteine-containing dehydrogenase